MGTILSRLRLFYLLSLAFFFCSCAFTTNTIAENLVIVPRTLVRVDATTGNMLTLALSTKELRNVFDVQELLQCRHVAAANNFDLTSCLLVHETFDHSPDSAKKHGSVNDK